MTKLAQMLLGSLLVLALPQAVLATCAWVLWEKIETPPAIPGKR